MDHHITTELQQLQKLVSKILLNMVTKDEAKQLVTKDDLKSFATKDDLKPFVTKNDLKSFATKDDLKPFATKDDINLLRHELRGVEERLSKEIEEVEISVTISADKNKAEKSIVETLTTRVDKIEQKLSL